MIPVMNVATADLPDDVEALKAMIIARETEFAALRLIHDEVKDRNTQLAVRNIQLENIKQRSYEKIAALTSIVKALERSQYVNDQGNGTPDVYAKGAQTQSRCILQVMLRSFRQGISVMKRRFGSMGLVSAGFVIEHAEINSDVYFWMCVLRRYRQSARAANEFTPSSEQIRAASR